METITLQVTTADFKNAGDFLSNSNCLLATAGKRMFPNQSVGEYVNNMDIGHRNYAHKEFGKCEHDEMYKKFDKSKPDDHVVFEIELF